MTVRVPRDCHQPRKTSGCDDEDACTCRVSQFSAPLSIFQHRQHRGARVYSDTYYALFSPAKMFSSARATATRSRRRPSFSRPSAVGRRRVAAGLTCESRMALCPFFGGLSEERGTRETTPTLASALDYYYPSTHSRSTTFHIRTRRTLIAIAIRCILPPGHIYRFVRSLARARDQQSQHSREARAGTDSRRD